MEKLVRDELESNRPVIYSGNNSEGGHAFICDGYKEDEAFHINWGWGGISNGYFYFPHWIPTAGMILTFYMGWE